MGEVYDLCPCSFCGKTKQETEFVIAGPPRIFICAECIDLCASILLESRTKRAQTTPPPAPVAP